MIDRSINRKNEEIDKLIKEMEDWDKEHPEGTEESFLFVEKANLLQLKMLRRIMQLLEEKEE